MEGTNLSRIVGTGGRWSEDTATFLFALAGAKAQACPFVLQNSPLVHDTSGPNLGQTSKIQWFLLNEIFNGHPLVMR